MKNIAIIPARSGSKGLLDKNIRDLQGHPLIYYTIKAAQTSNCFDAIMVSTDSSEYADIARSCGAEVPFLRSENTSLDTSSSWDVVREVLDNYSFAGLEFDTFMLLQPTSPFRSAQDIVGAYKELELKGASAIVSVCEMEHSPEQCNTLPEDLSLEGFIKQSSKGKRRQEMPLYYRFNGAIYLGDTKTFYRNGSIYDEGCYAYIMDRLASIDIDDAADFMVAEALAPYLLNSESELKSV